MRSRFQYSSSPDFQFADGQNPGAAGTGCNRCRRPKSSSPNDRFRIRQDRPLRSLPYRYTCLLEERFDLFRGGDPHGLVLVSRPPIPQFQQDRTADSSRYPPSDYYIRYSGELLFPGFQAFPVKSRNRYQEYGSSRVSPGIRSIPQPGSPGRSAGNRRSGGLRVPPVGCVRAPRAARPVPELRRSGGNRPAGLPPASLDGVADQPAGGGQRQAASAQRGGGKEAGVRAGGRCRPARRSISASQ